MVFQLHAIERWIVIRSVGEKIRKERCKPVNFSKSQLTPHVLIPLFNAIYCKFTPAFQRLDVNWIIAIVCRLHRLNYKCINLRVHTCVSAKMVRFPGFEPTPDGIHVLITCGFSSSWAWSMHRLASLCDDSSKLYRMVFKKLYAGFGGANLNFGQTFLYWLLKWEWVSSDRLITNCCTVYIVCRVEIVTK